MEETLYVGYGHPSHNPYNNTIGYIYIIYIYICMYDMSQYRQTMFRMCSLTSFGCASANIQLIKLWAFRVPNICAQDQSTSWISSRSPAPSLEQRRPCPVPPLWTKIEDNNTTTVDESRQRTMLDHGWCILRKLCFNIDVSPFAKNSVLAAAGSAT